MRKVTAAFLFWFALETPAEANFISGNSLLDACEKTDAASSAFCMGTILAYYDMLYEMQYYCEDESRNRTAGQLRDVVVKYLREHPVGRDIRASALSFFAITEAFDCNSPDAIRKK